MKYRVEFYDLDYEVDAKTEDGAVRGALARYAKTASANLRHCVPARLTRGDIYRDDRDWEVDKLGRRHVGRWERCRYLIGVTPIIVRALVEPEKVVELVS